jgi:hypothetical protein
MQRSSACQIGGGPILEATRALAQDGVTMLVATHVMQFAREVGTRILPGEAATPASLDLDSIGVFPRTVV